MCERLLSRKRWRHQTGESVPGGKRSYRNVLTALSSRSEARRAAPIGADETAPTDRRWLAANCGGPILRHDANRGTLKQMPSRMLRDKMSTGNVAASA